MPRPKHLVTPVFGFEYPELGAEGNAPEDFHQLALQLENLLKAFPVADLASAGAADEKKLLIVQATGAPAWKAMSGDATITAAGALTVANTAITTAKMALLAVTEAVLAGEAVSEAKIKALAVTAAKLAAEAVTEGKIANLAVATAKIANLAVTEGKIAELAVTAIKIAAEAVTTAKIQNLAVTEAKLAEGAVSRKKISTGTFQTVRVETEEVGAGAEKGVKVEWPVAFPDTNYTVAAIVGTLASNAAIETGKGFEVKYYDEKLAGSVAIIVKNASAGGQKMRLEVMGWHD